MSIANEIRECLTMREVVEFYGFEVNRGGYINCPFHSENTPSLRIYPGNRGRTASQLGFSCWPFR